MDCLIVKLDDILELPNPEELIEAKPDIDAIMVGVVDP